MAPKRARHRPESALKKRRRCQAARDVLAALCPPPPGHRINRAAAAASTGLQLGIGVEARGIAINAVRIVIVINLNDRTDRWNQFRCRSDAVDWQRGAEVVRLPAATPSHAMLAKGSEFGAVAKQNVHESIMKRNKCRACVLSHILALKKLEERKLTPALICEDDLVRTKEDAMRRVPLPALAAVVSVGHDPLVSADAPIAYEGGVAKRHWWPCGKQATNPRRPDIWYLPVQKARSCVRDWRRNFAMGFGHLWTIYYSTLVSLRISRKACTS